MGYLVSGMVAYGLVGWLIATLTHWTAAIPIGAIAGLILAIVGVFYKYGRP
jgi:ATP synthase protein I